MKLTVVACASVACAWLIAGCGRNDSTEPVLGEVRGEPIVRRVEAPDTNTNRTTLTASSPAPSTNLATAATQGAQRKSIVGFDKLSSYVFEVSDELLGPVTNDVAAAAAKTDAQIPVAVR